MGTRFKARATHEDALAYWKLKQGVQKIKVQIYQKNVWDCYVWKGGRTKKIHRKRESSLRECENPNSHKKFNNLKRTCDACKSKVSLKEFFGKCLTKPETWNIGRLTNYGQVTQENKPYMSIGEPVLVNTNSFDNITKILKEYIAQYWK